MVELSVNISYVIVLPGCYLSGCRCMGAVAGAGAEVGEVLGVDAGSDAGVGGGPVVVGVGGGDAVGAFLMARSRGWPFPA